MDTIALLRVSPALLGRALPTTSEGSDPSGRLGINGVPVHITPVEDGVLVYTQVPFASEPEELARSLKEILGNVLESHDDARGVFVFPDVARPKSVRYNEVITEVGEVGYWLRPGTSDRTDRTTASVASSGMEMDNLLDPFEVIDKFQRAFGTGDIQRLEDIRVQIENALSAQGGLEGLQRMLAQMLEQQGIRMEELQEHFSTLSDTNANFEEWLRQAQEEIEEMRQADPERFAELERQLQEQLEKLGKTT